jgi:hypothetical protein
MAGETSSRPTTAGLEISTRATPGISASIYIKKIREINSGRMKWFVFYLKTLSIAETI